MMLYAKANDAVYIDLEYTQLNHVETSVESFSHSISNNNNKGLECMA